MARKKGRKRIEERSLLCFRVNVSMNQETKNRLREIGGGNVSRGIRTAVDEYDKNNSPV